MNIFTKKRKTPLIVNIVSIFLIILGVIVGVFYYFLDKSSGAIGCGAFDFFCEAAQNRFLITFSPIAGVIAAGIWSLIANLVIAISGSTNNKKDQSDSTDFQT